MVEQSICVDVLVVPELWGEDVEVCLGWAKQLGSYVVCTFLEKEGEGEAEKVYR